MKKILIALGVVVALAVGYWLISPLFIEEQVDETLQDILSSPVDEGVVGADTEMREEMSEVAEESGATPTVLKRGDFSGLAGHNGEGAATLLAVDGKYYIRFENDFRVTNGPDLFVHFGRNGQYASEARIGELKGNVGGQNYEVPVGIDPLDYNEVWVWCRAFSIPFASAKLN